MKLLMMVILLFLCSCTSKRIGDFTTISTKNVDVDEYVVLGRFESSMQDDIKSCVDDCLEKGNGNIIINAVVEFRDRVFTYGYVVKGDVCVKKDK